MPVDENDEDALATPLLPEDVLPTSPDPAALSEEAPPSTESIGEVTIEPEPEAQATESDTLPAFDERYKEPFEGLMFIGRLDHSFQYLGHQIVIHTLDTEEVLDVGLVARKYADTVGELKAYQCAVVAACVKTVDGQAPPSPLTVDPDETMVSVRFPWASKLFPVVLDAIYDQFLVAEAEVQRVIDALGKVSDQAQTSIPT